MLAALVALAGLFVALYLTMFKMGYIGNLVCTVGSCETVQTSRWATLFGMPVAAWGVAFYLGVLAVSLGGISASLQDRVGVSRLLVGMTAIGVLFSLWLTYLELFVIHAICMWCVISAILSLILLVVCLLDLRETMAVADDQMARAVAQLRDTGFGLDLRNVKESTARAVREDPKRPQH